jgi:hypothetical protein
VVVQTPAAAASDAPATLAAEEPATVVTGEPGILATGESGALATDEPGALATDEPPPPGHPEPSPTDLDVADGPVAVPAISMTVPDFDLPEDFTVVEGGDTAPAALPAERAGGDPQVDALERWLETIIAERQRRA